jgi:hypothetical protein
MGCEAARVSPWTEVMVERVMRSAGNGYRFHVPADASIDEIDRSADLATVKAEKPMANAIMLVVAGSHDTIRSEATTTSLTSL